MNKRHLSSIRRSPLLRVACILILAVMFAPAAMAATALPSAGLPVASGIGAHAGSAFLAAGLGAGYLMLRAPAGEEGDAGGGGGESGSQADDKIDVPAALAAIEDKTLPMSQRLGVAMKALRGIPPAEQFTKVTKGLAAAQTDLTQARNDLEAANKQITALQADVKQLEDANAKLEKENKDLAAKEQDLDKRASEKAKLIARSVGVPAAELPAAKTGEEGQPTAEDRIRALEGTKRMEAALHFQQHGKLPAWMA